MTIFFGHFKNVSVYDRKKPAQLMRSGLRKSFFNSNLDKWQVCHKFYSMLLPWKTVAILCLADWFLIVAKTFTSRALNFPTAAAHCKPRSSLCKSCCIVFSLHMRCVQLWQTLFSKITCLNRKLVQVCVDIVFMGELCRRVIIANGLHDAAHPARRVDDIATWFCCW